MQDTHCRQHKYLRNQAQNIKVLDTSVKRGYLYIVIHIHNPGRLLCRVMQATNMHSTIYVRWTHRSSQSKWFIYYSRLLLIMYVPFTNQSCKLVQTNWLFYTTGSSFHTVPSFMGTNTFIPITSCVYVQICANQWIICTAARLWVILALHIYSNVTSLKKKVTSHITQVINNNSHIQTNMDDLSIHPQWIHIFNFVVTETIYH